MTVASLTAKGWTAAEAGRHPLGALRGKPAGPFRLLVLLGPKSRLGADYFQVFLESGAGDASRQPVVAGLFNRGPHPAYNWIEVSGLLPRVALGDGEAVLDDASVRQLFRHLAGLIPPGGHLMVEYDSPEQQDTARSLEMGIPPAATRLGHLLFLVGCGAGFKDWYFSEGGMEGGRKLQGYKALNGEHARLKAEELERELETFLRRASDRSELVEAARARAHDVLKRLRAWSRSP